MSWWRRRIGKAPTGKPAGQLSMREYLETGKWRNNNTRNTYRHTNDPRFQNALKSHHAALRELDRLIGISRGQEHLIDLFISLGDETDDGLWTPK